MVSHPYRVFVSYAHDDAPLPGEVINALRGQGLNPISDADITPGTPYAVAIQRMIATAHALVIVLTPRSQARKWVDQEIGYAVARGVPVVPLARDATPGEMLDGIQAAVLPACASNLQAFLEGEVDWDTLIRESRDAAAPLFECWDTWERRAEHLRAAAVSVERHSGRREVVRQRAGLTSFSLPDEPADAEIWDTIDWESARTPHMRVCEAEERQWLQRHARDAGCKLVIAPDGLPHDLPEARAARCARLGILRRFLEKPGPGGVEVVVRNRDQAENLLIMGDWFVAQSSSVAPGAGYRQTFATWHAPTVHDQLRRFDEDFDRYLVSQHAATRGRSSRDYAVERIDQAMAKLCG